MARERIATQAARILGSREPAVEQRGLQEQSMKVVFIVSSTVRRESMEGQEDVVIHFQRVDTPNTFRESAFDLVFGTKDAHLASQFPLGRRFVLTPEGQAPVIPWGERHGKIP
jgi:hypothetical protein